MEQTTSWLSRVGVGWFGTRVVYKDILGKKEKSLRPDEIVDVRGRVAKRQNPSKSHLFQELENSLIFR